MIGMDRTIPKYETLLEKARLKITDEFLQALLDIGIAFDGSGDQFNPSEEFILWVYTQMGKELPTTGQWPHYSELTELFFEIHHCLNRPPERDEKGGDDGNP